MCSGEEPVRSVVVVGAAPSSGRRCAADVLWAFTHIQTAAECCTVLCTTAITEKEALLLPADAASSEQVRPLALNDTECHRNTH